MKHASEIAKFIENGDCEMTEEGLLVHSALIARGKYFHTVNGDDEQIDHNLVPAEGILYFLNVTLGATAKPTGLYLALSASGTPASGWTAATYAASYENTSTIEGYTGASRPEWVDSAAAAGKIGNLSSRATYTIACTTTVSFTGAALIADQATRGVGTGSLISASNFAATRTLNNGDTFELGYEVELTDS